MRTIHVPEGARVAYAGPLTREQIAIGDEGRVLVTSASTCHVIMRTGARVGEVMMIAPEDLTVLAAPRHAVDDSLSDGTLDTGPFLTTAVRRTYDRHGEKGLLTALASRGELPDFEPVAEDAVQRILASIRTHPTIIRVVAELDEEEGEGLIQSLAMSAINEVLG